jgi:hypothetical protein
MRQTAATRVVEMDFQIPALIADLRDANETYATASEAKLLAQREHDIAKLAVDHEKSVITDGLVTHLTSTNAKITQAEIDRKVKSELFNNDPYRDLEDKAGQKKLELDEATALYEQARIHHRTLVAQLNAASAALNFMSSSKTARAVALQNLSDL